MFKPRFGGINFSLSICRAVVVGPLTFVLWLWWAFTRRSYNYLKSFSNSNQTLMYKKLIKSKLHPNGNGGPGGNSSQCHSQTVTPLPATTTAAVGQIISVPSGQSSIIINQMSPPSDQKCQNEQHQHQHQHETSKLCQSDTTSSHFNSNEIQCQLPPGPPSLVTSPVIETSLSKNVTSNTQDVKVNIDTSFICESSSKLNITSDAVTTTATKEHDEQEEKQVKKCKVKKDKLTLCSTAKSDSISSEPTNEPLIGCGNINNYTNSNYNNNDDDNLVSSCRKKGKKEKTFDPFKSIYWTSVELPKIYRIKQITRSCLNDVILAGISGKNNTY